MAAEKVFPKLFIEEFLCSTMDGITALVNFPHLADDSVEKQAADFLWNYGHVPFTAYQSLEQLTKNPPSQALYIFNDDCRYGVKRLSQVDLSDTAVIVHLENIHSILPDVFYQTNGIKMSSWKQTDMLSSQALQLQLLPETDSDVSFYHLCDEEVTYLRSSTFDASKQPYRIDSSLLFDMHDASVFNHKQKQYISWPQAFDRA